MGVAGGPDLIQDGLVLSLDASDRNSYVSGSTIWFDLSGLNNSGSLTNGPTFDTGSLGSIVFDGTNDYVLVSSGSTSINPTTAITVASFFNISSYGSNYAPIVFKQNNYTSYYEQYALALTNTQVLFTVSSGGTASDQKGAFSISDYRNKFTYAVGTCDTVTDELKLYINGVLIQTTPFTSSFDIADTPLNIGGTGVLKFGATYTGWTNGKIFNTQIYNRALSAQEVLQNYNAQKSKFGL